MEQVRTRLAEQATESAAAPAAGAGQPSQLLRQALGWASVAHEANKLLQADAEAELRLRRQESAQ